MSFFWQIVNSLAQGSLYALIALGYCLVFSVLRFINFAHGDFLMVGAYAGLFFSAYFPISQAGIILTIVASGIICALLGIFLQSVVYKPFMKNTEKNSSNLLVCAIGVSFLLQYGISAICSSRPRGYLANFSGEIINVFGIYTDSGKI
ncbi:MAG: branched-chain amino acid ABC transporter permease, partial [Oscillospiraceae bacterium]